MNLPVIVRRGMWHKNSGNRALFACVFLFVLLPLLLYNVSNSLMGEAGQSYQEVYGRFTDILYAPEIRAVNDIDELDAESANFLDRFSPSRVGVLTTVYRKEINESRNLLLGFGDQEAMDLASITVLSGHLPRTEREVVLTESMADLLLSDNSTVGSWRVPASLVIDGHEFTVSGIIADYGRLWVKGEEQSRFNIEPPNVLVTKEAAEEFLTVYGALTKQILLVQGDNLIPQVESRYHFQNLNTKGDLNFTVPRSFMLILLLLFVLTFLLLLALNRKRYTLRLERLYRLGMNRSEMLTGSILEMSIIVVAALLTAIAASFILSHAILTILRRYLLDLYASRSFLDYSYNWTLALRLGLLMLILSSVFIVFHSIRNVRASIHTVESQNEKKRKHFRYRSKFSLSGFVIKQNFRAYFLLLLVTAFLFSLVSYGVFYGSYFTIDILDVPEGTLTRDYDFQLVSRPEESVPWDDPSDPIAFFTDTYEKLGASDEFVEALQVDPFAREIRAYKENTKYKLLIQNRPIDSFLDGSDFVMDENFTSIFPLNEATQSAFAYEPSDILVEGPIIGYPLGVMESLQDAVVEGEINFDKLRSGEEIVLQAPPYYLEETNTGGIMHVPTHKDDPRAHHLTMFEVGDEVVLSGVVSDEAINGAVPESRLSSFRRHDVTVKIGAIIRSADGDLASSGMFFSPLSFLTLNEAFESLDIPAAYSNVSIYANHDYSDAALVEHFLELSNEYPKMVFENWLSDLKAYTIYNTTVWLFVWMLIAILLFASLTIMISQHLNVSRLSMRIYTLLRINGSSYSAILRTIIGIVVALCFLGSAIGIPLSLALFRLVSSDFILDIWGNIFYYFPPRNFIYIFLLTALSTVLAFQPTWRYLRRYKDNVLLDLRQE